MPVVARVSNNGIFGTIGVLDEITTREPIVARVVLVGGGGGGAGAWRSGGNAADGGAGGAGGMIDTVVNLSAKVDTYTVVVGAGGTRGGDNNGTNPGTSGFDSTLAGTINGQSNTFTAIGGGYGSWSSNPGGDGGSAGSGASGVSGSALQPISIWGGFGNAGNQSGGGAGSAGSGTTPGAGRAVFNGTTYAAGGTYGSQASGGNNTGDGGGSAFAPGSGGTRVGGGGGSGIVLITYPAPAVYSGGTITTQGSNIVHTFTTSGSLTTVVPSSSSFKLSNTGTVYALQFDEVSKVNRYSFDFNINANSHLDIGNTTNLKLLSNGSNFTFETWFYGPSAAGSHSIITSIDQALSNPAGIFVPLTGSNKNISFAIHNRTNSSSPVINYVSSNNVWTSNTWQHLAITFDNTQNPPVGTIYVNGNVVTLSTNSYSGGSFITTADNITPAIGSRYNSGGGSASYTSFKGQITGIRISNSVIYTANFTPTYTSTTQRLSNTVFLLPYATSENVFRDSSTDIVSAQKIILSSNVTLSNNLPSVFGVNTSLYSLYRISNTGSMFVEGYFDETFRETINVEIMLLAGGGAGTTYAGGGAGGFLYRNDLSFYNDTVYAITVGAGGAVGLNGSNTTIVSTSGSHIFSNTAVGGGRGGLNGGSGGGGGGQPVTGQGFAGGNGTGLSGGGGGGSGGVGQDGSVSYTIFKGSGTFSSATGGTGGTGRYISISGANTIYGGGGGGGNEFLQPGFLDSPYVGQGGAGGGGRGGGYNNVGGETESLAGTANLGAGGGGGGVANASRQKPANTGGSGIAIISYTGIQLFNGGTVTTNGGNTVHIFTSSGTLVRA